MKLSLAAVIATGLGFLALSCGEPTESASPDDVFVAFAEDFRGYHSWQSFDVSKTARAVPPEESPDAGQADASAGLEAADGGEAEAGIEAIHVGKQVIEYVKELPASGNDAFPVGTLIVKESTDPGTEPRIFAMAKRGGSYNKRAPGWEWFELEGIGDDRDGVKIIWRGVGPPKGETYGGDPNGGCNGCHGACTRNDSVCSAPLTLSNF
jgi:hypothetical protein